ncbi:GAF domain-containing protein [Streptomyces sp. NPDC087425]|uniref:sensor histidine kinase n=1 Tax=Streptomyces sp. NPDC087425 TaxID=3365787 RepID=UPI00381F11A6
MPDRLPPLLEAVLGVGAELELRTTLQRLVDSAAELTGARYATLATTGPGLDGLPEIRTPGPLGDSGATLSVPIHVRGKEFGHLHLTGKEQQETQEQQGKQGKRAGKRNDGRGNGVVGAERFTAEDAQVLHVLAAQAGIAIGNARLYEAARQRERWIEGAAAVTNALLTGERAADALTTVAEQARILADAAAGVILQPTPEGGMEIVTASTPDDPDTVVGATIRPGSPVLVQLLGGEAVFIDDSATDPRMTTPVRHRFGPSMMLPLQTEGRLIGTLALPRRRGDRPYTDVERLLAAQFASQAALALVLADAQRGRERLAVFEDRDRIARDLHDLVIQRLFATGMMLESTRRGAPVDEVHETLGRAVDELQSTIQEVRTTIVALQQPPAEAPTTFRGRVLRETAGAAARLGFAPSTHFTGPLEHRVPDRTAGHLLAALRRALATTTRRPGVTRVEITVDATATLPDGRAGLRLTVHDNGHTTDDGTDDGTGDAPDDDGTGTRRGSGNGSGTTVVWQAPLQR